MFCEWAIEILSFNSSLSISITPCIAGELYYQFCKWWNGQKRKGERCKFSQLKQLLLTLTVLKNRAGCSSFEGGTAGKMFTRSSHLHLMGYAYITHYLYPHLLTLSLTPIEFSSPCDQFLKAASLRCSICWL